MRHLRPCSMPAGHRRLTRTLLPSLQLHSQPPPVRLRTQYALLTFPAAHEHASTLSQFRRHASRSSTKPATAHSPAQPSASPSHPAAVNGEQSAAVPIKHSVSSSPLSSSPRSPSSTATAAAAAAAASSHSAPLTEQSEMSNFLGASSRYTTALSLTLPSHYEAMPCFRLTSSAGQLLVPYTIPHSAHMLRRMYSTMIYTSTMDAIFYDAQRQGRISFYMTNYGEEASHIGSVSALRDDDVIFGQYREAGVFMWRGFPLQQFAHQCFSNCHDLGKGRQMPVHYGSRALNIQTISSPLGTQLPQAAGAAYALKMEGKGRIAMCYFGEGAASEGDFHPALNMSATLDCPVIFFCRNNGYAISTPSREQYRGDGIASRAHGYGIAAIRVDGNDLLAVYEATREAREYAVRENKPVLVEAMTYRGGHHSTSDDSTRYRSTAEIAHWMDNENPITRFRLLLEGRGLWDSTQEVEVRQRARADVLKAMNVAESSKKPPISQMFEDVYDRLTPQLAEQREQLRQHLDKWGDKYAVEGFERDELYRDPMSDGVGLVELEEERRAEGGANPAERALGDD